MTKPSVVPSVVSPTSSSKLFRRTTNESTRKKPQKRNSLLDYAGLAHPKPAFELLKIHGRTPRTDQTPELTAISAKGHTVAVLVKRQFWTFDPETCQMLCTGDFHKKTTYKYATDEGKELKVQHPLPTKFRISSFVCCALSDEFLAIGTDSKIMIFSCRGTYAGRWLACDDIPDSVVKRMAFSPDGTELVALVSVEGKDASYDGARIYSTAKFTPEDIDIQELEVLRQEAMAPVVLVWPRDHIHDPNGISFSKDGRKVAICTTHSRAKAGIRILKKEISTWRAWGFTEVTVHTADHKDWVGRALTGITLYFLS
jgi:hypothetical protein